MQYTLPTEYIDLFHAGDYSIRELDTKFNINRNLSPLLRKLAGLHVASQVKSSERYAQIEPLLEQGYSQRKIANLLNCSLNTIHNCIKENK